MKALTILFLLAGSIVHGQHIIQLKSGKSLKDVEFRSEQDRIVTYRSGQTLHDLAKSEIDYIVTDSAYVMFDTNNRQIRKPLYTRKDEDSSVLTPVYHNQQVKSLMVKDQKLMKSRSQEQKFGIGTGQVLGAAALAGAGMLVGGTVGLIGGAVVQSNGRNPDAIAAGGTIGVGTGFLVGTMLGVSLVGQATYGYGAPVGTAIGTAVGLAAGATLIAAEAASPNRVGYSIPFALLAPVTGGLIGYYHQLGNIKKAKLATSFHTDGNNIGMTLTF